MDIQIKVPVLPESVSEATLVSWQKQPGDQVRLDELLIEIETDKVVLEVVATEAGVLKEILAPDGAKVSAEQVIGVLAAGATANADKPAVTNPQEQAQPVAIIDDASLSPAVRKLLQENGIAPGLISGTGKAGRILKEDVLEHLKVRQKPAPSGNDGKAAEPPLALLGLRPEERVPMTRIRARIAERLVQAQRTAAILTTFNEVNMRPVMDLRARYKDTFQQRHGAKLGFMSFFVKASVDALRRYPLVNAAVDGQDIVYHGYYDIGVAISAPRGLVVPILRDADSLSFAAIEKKIADFGQQAQDNKLALDDLLGGTFSISNGGIFGSMLSTPILNPPQSAILGMHNIVERAVVENGAIVVRPVMYLALSYDHRIIDGREAVSFLVAIKQVLEDPARLLLEV